MKPTNHTQDHAFLELIRRLEQAHFEFATPTAVATEQARQTDGTPMDKLIARARILDSNQNIMSHLNQAFFHFGLVGKIWGGVCFLLGFLAIIGLLGIAQINFFYTLVAILGWHFVSFVIWLIRPQSHHLHAFFIGKLLDKTMQKSDTLSKYAHDVVMNAHKPTIGYTIAKIMHKGWVLGFLGNVLALVLLFLFKSYQFVWESTLLTQAHFVKIIDIIGFLPSLLGIPKPALTGDTAQGFAMFLIACVVIYGLIPRLLAYGYCCVKSGNFTIDKNLYYYENLMRTLSRQIIDKDDYTAPTHKPVLATVTTNKKIVASLETAFDDTNFANGFWYQAGAGFKVMDLGVMDTKEQINALQKAVQFHQAQVYLGIDTAILPDRGVVKKLLYIASIADFGLAVELIDTTSNHYRNEWQQVLITHQISEVRY